MAAPAASSSTHASHPAEGFTPQKFHFDEFTLDESRYSLQRGERALRLEKRPMELLFLLVERRGELVSREEIAERLWGKDVFVDVEHGINTAIRKVRLALHDDPEHPRYVETVVGKGYRFAAPVICSSNGQAEFIRSGGPGPKLSEISPSASGAAAVASARAPQTLLIARKRLLIGAASLVIALVAIGFLLKRRGTTKQATQPAIRSLAVLPLENLSGDPSQEYLADGMTEELIGRLSAIRGLRVISRTSVMRFKDAAPPVPEIAKTLRVDAVVEGSVIRDGSRIRVHAQLIRGATDEHFWSATYDGELRDALALESDIAQSIAEKVEVTVTGNERERLTAVRPVAPDVYENYLEGMHALYDKQPSRANIEQGIRYLNEAIRKDPTFARPYLHLANAYDNLGSNFIGVSPEETLPKTISAARKAVELDPNLAEAHAFLGYVETREYRWAEAEAEFKRALELNPNNADTYESFGYWLLAQGRTEEAVVWARRGRELDPYTVSGNDMGFILLCARRYDEAEREYRSVLAMAPDDRNGLWSLGFLMVVNGHAAEAIPILEKAVSLSQHSPGVTGTLINAYAQAGRRADAMRLLAELKRRKQAGYVPAMAFVWAYLGLGDREQVFAWLEQAYKEKSNFVQWMKVHPIFDSVRGDPRFADLVHRVGLDKN